MSISPLALAALATVLAVGGWGWFFFDRARGPIIWTWRSENWPVMISRSGDNYGVYAFAFRGTNRWDEPSSNIKTFVKSNITGDTVPLFFAEQQRIEPEKVVIPPGVSFNLEAVLAKDGPLISFDAFKSDYSNFTFFFEHDGASPFTKTFTEADVDRLISEGRKFHEELFRNTRPPGQGSGIRVKP